MAETLSPRVARVEQQIRRAFAAIEALADKQEKLDDVLVTLAESQIKADARMEKLAEAQLKTEQLFQQTDARFAKTDERSAKTDERIEKLVIAIGEFLRRNGGAH